MARKKSKRKIPGCNLRDSFCGTCDEKFHGYKKQTWMRKEKRIQCLRWMFFRELMVYLRQGLHNGVQQSSHPHRHLQELQHCGHTHTHTHKTVSHQYEDGSVLHNRTGTCAITPSLKWKGLDIFLPHRLILLRQWSHTCGLSAPSGRRVPMEVRPRLTDNAENKGS